METTTNSQLPSAVAESPILRWSGQRRVKYFVTGVIGPISCLVMAGCGLNARITPLWQSGELKVYLNLMLEPKTLLPFNPLFFFSMLALGACCVDQRLAKNLWVRIGVYGGCILSAQYLFFVVFVFSFFPLLCAAVVGLSLALVTYIAANLMPRARRITIFQMLLLTTIAAIIAAVASALIPSIDANGMEFIYEYGLGLLFWTLVAVPFLNCMTYIRAAVALLRSPALAAVSNSEYRKLLALASGWLVGFGASWKFSLDEMLAEYARLPTSPPNCYISSAAACGHPQFVGVTQFSALEPTNEVCDGFPLNEQMCRLKFLEFALAAFSPRLHRLMRRAYNAVGPHAAAVCRRNVWFADASYIAMKPLEFGAYLVQSLSRVTPQEVRGLYLPRSSGCQTAQEL